MLTNQKKLAKTSGTPGKTRLINHFIINESWYLVDLPGYGYARASKKDIKTWEKFIVDYLLQRANLVNLFVLIDSRLEPQKIDIEFINWCGEKGIPFSIVFTKLDKLSGSEFSRNLSKYKKELQKSWETIPPVFSTSSTSKHGRESILNYIEEIIKAL
jgi:GTP-binding protein